MRELPHNNELPDIRNATGLRLKIGDDTVIPGPRTALEVAMSLTLLRYRETPVAPQAVVEVSSPQDAVSLLRAWQLSYPQDSGMVLDDNRQPIATCQPGTTR